MNKLRLREVNYVQVKRKMEQGFEPRSVDSKGYHGITGKCAFLFSRLFIRLCGFTIKGYLLLSYYPLL